MTGALTPAGELRAPLLTVAAPQAQLPLEQEREGCGVEDATPSVISTLSTRTMETS